MLTASILGVGWCKALTGTSTGQLKTAALTGKVARVLSLTGPNPNPLQLVPLTPCRLVDTRQTGQPIQGGTWQAFAIPQLGNCNIPATAAAYSLNVTVVPPRTVGIPDHLAHGRGTAHGIDFELFFDGRTKANAAIVPAGTSGAVSVYCQQYLQCLAGH